MPPLAYRTACAAFVLLASLRAQSAPESAPADYKKVRYAEVTALVPKLSELAAWCGESKLFRERDRLDALIITLDADNAGARAALLYRKQKDGAWARPADWKEAKNSTDKPLPELSKRRSELVDPVISRLIDALDREKSSMEPATRRIWMAELFEIGPDNARLRELAGEKLLKGKWVLVETVSALERRPEASSLARLCRDGEKKLADGKPDDFEASVSLKWTAIRETPFARVVATVPPAQVDKALRKLDAAWTLVFKIFGKEPSAGIRPSIVLLRNSGEVATFLAKHKETPDADRGQEFADYTLSDARVVVAGHELEAERIHDAIVRTVTLATQEALGGSIPSWLLEGLGLHVTQLVLGQRQPMYGAVNQPTAQDSELYRMLEKPDANWLAIAADRVKAGKAAKLERVLCLEQFKMTPLDSLFAAAFTAYLIEGRPADALTFVRVANRGLTPAAVATEALGIPLPELESRFYRWLGETTASAPK